MGRSRLEQCRERVIKSPVEKSPKLVQRKMCPSILRRSLQNTEQNEQEIELGLYPDKEFSFLVI